MTAADIRVTLVEDQGDGLLFFSDICRMLERLAARVGCDLTAVSQDDSGHPPTRAYRCGGQLHPLLSNELGGHRGQLVPAGGDGRVMTARVNVEVSTVPGADAGAVIKTYNYVQARVIRHATGERLPLPEVLAGREAMH
ncbi:MAG: hypothetical protein AB7O37_16195 [Vicinamibacteria bacterium]